MKNLIRQKSAADGFTLMELVVTVVLMGILVSVSIPAYSGATERTQGKRNEANMQTIREVFFHYLKVELEVWPYKPPRILVLLLSRLFQLLWILGL